MYSFVVAVVFHWLNDVETWCQIKVSGFLIISFCYCKVWIYNCQWYLHVFWGSLWHTWLRHCATSQKVSGSVLIFVNESFHGHIPSSHCVALVLTGPQTEMATRIISQGSKAAGALGWILTTFICRLSQNLWAWTCWKPLSLLLACTGTALPYHLFVLTLSQLMLHICRVSKTFG
jgi:hypothetical protein